MKECQHEWRLIREDFTTANMDDFGYKGCEDEVTRRWYCVFCRKVENVTEKT